MKTIESGRNRILVGSFDSHENAREAGCENRAHLVIARIRRKFRTVEKDFAFDKFVLTPEGAAFEIGKGRKIGVAGKILSVREFVRKRLDGVRWFSSSENPEIETPELTELEKYVLELAKDMGLFTDGFGNVSFRREGGLAITPRGIDKSKLTESDFIRVRADLSERKIEYSGHRKPSIDSWVHAAAYAHDAEISAIIHSHNPWLIGAPETEFPFPCGVAEEADEILAKLWNGPFSVVEMADHGAFIAIRGGDAVKTLAESWYWIKRGWEKHLGRLGEFMPKNAKIVPMFSENRIIGSTLVHEDGSVSPRLLQEFQGRGIGKKLVERARVRGAKIRTVEACGVEEVYAKRGFIAVERDAWGRDIVLRPQTEEEKRSEKSAESVKAWVEPFSKELLPTVASESFREMPYGVTGIPIAPHPGWFGTVRAKHVHEGVDLYCEPGTKIRAVEAGTVVAVVPFTWPQIGMPWWLDTWAVIVEGASGNVIYGEIEPCVKEGQVLKAGENLGKVIRVLAKDKGRPTSMLHLELRERGVVNWDGWYPETGKPKGIKDPTPYLLRTVRKDPFV